MIIPEKGYSRHDFSTTGTDNRKRWVDGFEK